MKILGIDPGSRNLGYCILSLDGVKYSLIEAGLIKIKQNELQTQIIDMIEGIDLILKKK